MRLDAAIKSGRAFKRPSMTGWLDCAHGTQVTHAIGGTPYALTVDDLLAEDWQAYENAACTRYKVHECLKDWLEERAYLSKDTRSLVTDFAKCVVKDLGL